MHLQRRILYIVTTLLLIICCWYWVSNDYMTSRDYTVKMVDKFKEERCHKSSCNLYLKGLFRTEDGDFFDLDLTMASYTRLHPGSEAVFELRPFDIKQTPRENLLYFFGPVIVYSLTLSAILWSLVCVIVERKDAKAKKESK